MITFETRGRIISKGEMQTGISKTNKEWKKIAFVFQEDSKYENRMSAQAFGDNAMSLTHISPDDIVEIEVEVRAREYNGKWYNDLTLQKVVVKGTYPARPEKEESVSAPQGAKEESEDLPF